MPTEDQYEQEANTIDEILLERERTLKRSISIWAKKYNVSNPKEAVKDILLIMERYG